MSLSRRRVLLSGALATPLLAMESAGLVAAATQDVAAAEGAKSRERALRPLPFDPTKLRGLSERLLRSHHENNYGGAVRNLNKVRQELARAGKDTPAFLLGGLKERELVYGNSATLHEHYFGNLGGDGRAAGKVAEALATVWGSLGRWEQEFLQSAQSLAGGSGWVVLAWDFQDAAPVTAWSGHHSQALSFGAPLLVLDMYEHAFHLDYGAAAMKYVEAFMANVAWDEVERRYQRALAAQQVLKA